MKHFKEFDNLRTRYDIFEVGDGTITSLHMLTENYDKFVDHIEDLSTLSVINPTVRCYAEFQDLYGPEPFDQTKFDLIRLHLKDEIDWKTFLWRDRWQSMWSYGLLAVGVDLLLNYLQVEHSIFVPLTASLIFTVALKGLQINSLKGS